jgi:hypothetical protein
MNKAMFFALLFVGSAGCASSSATAPEQVNAPVADSSPAALSQAPGSDDAPAPAPTHAGKIAQCNALIEVLNRGALNIDQGTKAVQANPLNTAAYKGLADSATTVAKEASALRLAIPELQKFSESYQTVMKEFARTARATAAALEVKDKDGMTAAANDMESVGKREEAIIADINAFCQAPP